MNEALNQAIIGRLKAESVVSNFVLTKHFIEIQREGFVPQYRILKEKFETENGFMKVSVCVEASIRSIAFELTNEFFKDPPSLALAVINGEISKSAGADFIDGVYTGLREKYGSGIILPPRQEGAAGIFRSPQEALTANAGRADFLIAFSGLSFSERAGRVKTLRLSVKELSFYSLGRGPAEELPLSVPGEAKSYSGFENVAGRKRIMGEMQDWSVAGIDALIRRAMAAGDKTITFTEPLPFEQFSDFSKTLEKALAGVDAGIWGRPGVIPRQDKNYFRVRWRGPAFELAQALAAQLNGKDRRFRVERTNFQTVLLSPVPVIAKSGVVKQGENR